MKLRLVAQAKAEPSSISTALGGKNLFPMAGAKVCS